MCIIALILMFTGILKLTLDMSKLLNFITRDQEQNNVLHHSLFYRFPRLWEGLPLNVRKLVISGLLPFITELRKHILSPGTNLDLPAEHSEQMLYVQYLLLLLFYFILFVLGFLIPWIDIYMAIYIV